MRITTGGLSFGLGFRKLVRVRLQETGARVLARPSVAQSKGWKTPPPHAEDSTKFLQKLQYTLTAAHVQQTVNACVLLSTQQKYRPYVARTFSENLQRLSLDYTATVGTNYELQGN